MAAPAAKDNGRLSLPALRNEQPACAVMGYHCRSSGRRTAPAKQSQPARGNAGRSRLTVTRCIEGKWVTREFDRQVDVQDERPEKRRKE